MVKWTSFLFLYKRTGCPYCHMLNEKFMGTAKGFKYTILPSTILCGKVRQKRSVLIKKNDFKFTKTINAPFSEPFVQTNLVSLYRIVTSSWLIAPHCIVTIFLAHEKFLSFRLRLRLNPLEPSHLALVNVKDCVLF